MSVFAKTRWIQYARLMRIEKPIGFFLLLWPTLWAVWIAGRGNPSFSIVTIFILGTFLTRSAGCVINDFADRDFDRRVKRTHDRPLTCGRVSSREALILFTLLSSAALSLTFFLNPYSFWLALVGGILMLIYPLMKRVVSFPQLFLGMAFSWGIPLAFAAQLNAISPVAWWLYLASLVWAVIYDTEYAMVDKEDDLKIGVKSTAILFGQKDRLIIFMLQVLMIFILCMIGVILKFQIYYFLACIVAFLLFMYHQTLIKNRNTERCFQAFLHNHWVGFVIFLGIFLNGCVDV